MLYGNVIIFSLASSVTNLSLIPSKYQLKYPKKLNPHLIPPRVQLSSRIELKMSVNRTLCGAALILLSKELVRTAIDHRGDDWLITNF